MFKFLQTNATDESLMLKYQQGDSAAFEELYSRHKNPLYAYLYRSHVDLSVIEEIAQETWIAVINAAEKYRASAKFKTYLYAIAHRKLVDFWRRSKLDQLIDRVDEKGEQIVDKIAGPGKHAPDSADLSMDLLLALETLSNKEQQAFLLREEGFSRKEIAVMTGSNEETIKSRIRYATAHLKRTLEVQYAD
ncbi:MAG: sigma-70 family RNA polymerase sigma factor [Gammaproteobacteria bacterium]|jgi:RNA polymerase sigma-70 factor (ECF subfamily)|nr:sigma-70 family RNA polymerase sigma factor [Gammaproteobacteria bacterium]HJO10523.1 sigma-70 family RNA polymerase sigma factor [Gammaproteobacteria bacterium]|tara:strand:+ start:1261 stop:1833 length:573 start_codon:yes stop_codon:yes gene_type:complete